MVQRRDEAQRDYEQLRSRDEDQAGPWSQAWHDAVGVNLNLPTEALLAWQGATRANLNLITETLRSSLGLFGLYRRP
jgi:hypothetical protein